MSERHAWERRVRDLTKGKNGVLFMNRETYDAFVGSFEPPPKAQPDDRLRVHFGSFKLAVDDSLQGDEIEFIPA
jgi:hypothetical protein